MEVFDAKAMRSVILASCRQITIEHCDAQWLSSGLSDALLRLRHLWSPVAHAAHVNPILTPINCDGTIILGHRHYDRMFSLSSRFCQSVGAVGSQYFVWLERVGP